MSCQDAIGVFDSGLGGLSAVKEFLHVLPNEKIIYFGDTGRVPYGNRSRETISKYAFQDASFLLKHNVKTVVAACGTVSSVAGDMLEERLPVPYTGVVNPTAFIADRKTKNGKIGIIGTAATISSHSYKLRLEKLNPKYKVYEQACPLFVPLVENGFICRDDQIVRLVIRRYLSELKETGVDTLILGCTHYPLLRDAIADFMGDGVTLVDSGYETAIYCAKILRENNLLNTNGEHQTPEFYVSDTPDGFKSVAGLFLGRDMEHTVTQIDIEQY
ncbi:glutamate racemase [Ruminococcus sp.]|uniref:glutamate racemase n=1 Tax=Ruminococcus sp. TaxID=41978 RepID=UPI0025E4886E|nr:glutamate racemase [Ruminococcus sp.]